MSLNFPNNPNPNDTYIDPNGKLWRFNDGYWQESIPTFSIDLLRDVHTIINTQSIVFVDSTGVESSIDASEDLPFILADNSVSNISFTPYDLPFYIADGTYDGIDIVQYTPPLNSMVYWDGVNWFPLLLTYQTSDLTGFNLGGAVVNDVMVWDITASEFIPEQKDLHVQYENSYNTGYLAEIETDGYMVLSDTQYNILYTQTFGLTVNSTDAGMIDLANNRLVCTSSGMYRICWFWKVYWPDASGSGILSRGFGFGTVATIYNSNGDVKDQNISGENSLRAISYYEVPQYNSRTIIDMVNLDVGDYIKFQIKKIRIPYDFANSSNHYGRISMFKIGDLQTSTTFVRTVNVDGKNDTTTIPLVISLDAGTYQIRPKKGVYTSVNPWSLVSGCSGGNNCSQGWAWTLRYTSAEFGGVTQTFSHSNGYQSTDDQALSEILDKSYKIFTLTYTQDMSLWFSDAGYSDNIGGMSFELWKVV